VSIRVRGAERDAVMALLETEHESVEALADALIKTVAAMLGERETYGVGLTPVAWGPFYDEASAKKCAVSVGGGVAKLYSPEDLYRKVTAKPIDYQCECGHPWVAHSAMRYKHYRSKAWSMPGCVVKGCECALITARKGAA
jgi:hypothetical protein